VTQPTDCAGDSALYTSVSALGTTRNAVEGGCLLVQFPRVVEFSAREISAWARLPSCAALGFLDTTRNMKNRIPFPHRILSTGVSLGVSALFLSVVNGGVPKKGGQASSAKDSFALADA